MLLWNLIMRKKLINNLPTEYARQFQIVLNVKNITPVDVIE